MLSSVTRQRLLFAGAPCKFIGVKFTLPNFFMEGKKTEKRTIQFGGTSHELGHAYLMRSEVTAN